MPTAAKMTAALLFAGLTWAAVALVWQRLPVGVPPGSAGPVCAAVGFLVGWSVMGRRAGVGAAAAAGHGLTTVAAIAVWCLALGAGWQALRRAMWLRYDSPDEALGDMALIAADYGRVLWHGPTLAVLLAGGVAAGLLAELAARRWS